MKIIRTIIGLFAVAVFGMAGSAVHADVRIVALGASNTYGKGVARGEAYPAQLQRLLKAKGINASVANAGINGDTTGGMLARLSRAVPAGTQIVILQPGGNDRRKGVDGGRTEANLAAIRSKLQARNIKVITLPNSLLGTIRHQSPAYDQGDGSHLTPAGYAALASRILPEVMQAIGR